MKWIIPLLIVGWGVSVWWLLRLNRRGAERVKFMLNAVSSGDYSFAFRSQSPWKRDRQTVENLNQVAALLAKARQETIDKERHYARILDNLHAGIVAYDEQGYVYQTNNEALRLLGLPVLTHLRQLSVLRADLPELLQSATAGGNAAVTFRSDKGPVRLSLRFSQSCIQDRTIRVATFTDITNDLDDQEIDSWVALTRVLTHEIMNAIGPIRSLSESLMQHLPEEDSELQKGLEAIRDTSKGLLGFVSSYRQFTHLPAPKPSPFYVKGCVEQTMQLLRSTLVLTTIDFRCQVSPEDLLVYADKSLISQVLHNLLLNAVQAIGDKPDGKIEVCAFQNESEDVVIEISDNGTIITPELAERIFVPFFTTKSNGMGVGLSLSRQIMRLSGGTLALRTHPQTTFVLTFGR